LSNLPSSTGAAEFTQTLNSLTPNSELPTPNSYTVVGDGAMGTAVALLLAAKPGRRVRLWCRNPVRAKLISETRRNELYLPNAAIPAEIEVINDFRANADADVFVAATPLVHLRATLAPLVDDWPKGSFVVHVMKGIERETLKRPSEILRELVAPRAVVALTGPSHAEELAAGLPATVVAASDDWEAAGLVQREFSTETFRIYRRGDLLGAELAGALKNVIAIAAGICIGLKLGDNALSALMTRGLAEMSRFGKAFDAEPGTFVGVAGIGDLVTTCISPFGRNRLLGTRLAAGESLEQVSASTTKVFEGAWTCRSIHDIAQRRGISMPITAEVHAILFEGKPPRQAVFDLMTRSLKDEKEG
jgi:glycerol-3-phosphate dehydrogenase (NAD(P)+)